MAQTIDVLKLEEKHAADYQASVKIPVTTTQLLGVEIDSVNTGFDTELCRVWYGRSNLGTFRSQDDEWLAESFYNNESREKTICQSADEARDVIVAAYQVGRGV